MEMPTALEHKNRGDIVAPRIKRRKWRIIIRAAASRSSPLYQHDLNSEIMLRDFVAAVRLKLSASRPHL